MIRRPPRSTQGVSSAASDVYKRQVHGELEMEEENPFTKLKLKFVDYVKRVVFANKVIHLKYCANPEDQKVLFSLSKHYKNVYLATNVVFFPAILFLAFRKRILRKRLSVYTHTISVILLCIACKIAIENSVLFFAERRIMKKLPKFQNPDKSQICRMAKEQGVWSVSYTHLRAHETSLHLVCRLLLEKKKKKKTSTNLHDYTRPIYTTLPGV
eukprot:TRINITY_DN20077_c0_g1_i3.p1 TRINITY_DN20077_c0_g1~~TRINITY_DN20077_c0_g1_i3.p1  ORF type:complete len:213 (-),score=35.74 TRINITY_DN20077_c0_g1_i3:56-694(-)